MTNLNVKKILMCLAFTLTSSISFADNFTVGYFKTLGFLFGPDTEGTDLQDSGNGNATAEIELLYLFGDQQGIAFGLVNGRKIEGYAQFATASRPRNRYESDYSYNGIKVGYWKRDPSGPTMQGLFTYGKGKFDFYDTDPGSTELTNTRGMIELEGRVMFPVWNGSDVSFDLYGGLRLYRMLMKDFDYGGITYGSGEVADWERIRLSLGLGVSY